MKAYRNEAFYPHWLPLVRVSESLYDYDYESLSFGIVLHAYDTGRWLLVKRKHNVELMLFLCGRYMLSDIPAIISSLTCEERDVVAHCLTSREVFFETAKKRFNINRPATLECSWETAKRCTSLIKRALSIYHDEPGNVGKWLWAKGRQEANESTFEAAVRELNEETGIDLSGVDHFICNQTISDTIASDHYNATNLYWIVIIREEIAVSPPPETETEIGDRKWISTEEVKINIEKSALASFDTIIEIVDNV